ncbi:MAG: cellulase family glycosylhydrolase [Pseudomonadota bacterium]
MKRTARLLCTFAASGSALGCASPSTRAPQSSSDFEKKPVATFEVDGAPLCFVGTNNYYLAYKPKAMVDDVLEAAQAMGVKVVRTWGFIDRGALDGSVPNIDGDGTKDGFYFQAWDAAAQRPVYNDGPTGLLGLDYALAKAAQLNLKIVLVLTNNWHDFGGMDQYLAWYGLSSHREFYTNANVKQAYRAWLAHLTHHVNAVTHVIYRDDPTIFAWELANEPRGTPGTPNAVVSAWADEMSSYLKALDVQHLVAVGDEGFLAGPSAHWTYHADNGVDHRALTALPNVDYGTFHMYPDTWGTGFGWPERWIDDHLQVARELAKPSVLEEYGLRVWRDDFGRVSEGLEARLANYEVWNRRILANGGSAAMFWLLAGKDAHGELYKDFDHFSVYAGDASAQLLRGFATRFGTAAPACLNAAHTAPLAHSPFASVRRAPPLSAFGWRPQDG